MEKYEYIYYALCALLSGGVLLGIYYMSKVEKSVLGNRLSAICLALGIILTMVYNEILPVWVLYIALAIGGGIGWYLAKKVKMIEMPQLVALLNGLGGAASAIVGGFAMFGIGTGLDIFSKTTASLAVAVGMLTLTGSLVAAGKLHKVISQKPVVWKYHKEITTGAIVLMVLSILLYMFLPNKLGIMAAFAVVIFLISGFFGYAFAIRVGGADMPITISLLNSLSGVAGAVAGLAINDLLLVAIGGIVGASGLLLTQIMCRSMNRSIMDILMGKTTSHDNKAKTTKVSTDDKNAEIVTAEKVEKTSPVSVLKNAKSVIIVPGYGMAIAQAQHLVKQLADKLVANGASVKYAVHPVAGRMPGHMNVLLCEADVDYEDLYEMDDINPEFANTDAVIVVGANDVLNPSARDAEGTPIYGMPILNVDNAKEIFIFNYDTNPGYAGVDNPLYTRTKGVHLYLGNASDTLKDLLSSMDSHTDTAETAPTVVDTQVSGISVLKSAKSVIIVPGYGMAIAQAQHLVKQLADKLVANGASVKYAVHPVAGRMPGHMNVLLCEADVDYEDLYEMDDINPEFASTDAVIVVGANDVLNPSARDAEGTPIYGMPILNVDNAKEIFIFNYDTNPGYAGVDNPLYTRTKGVHLYLGNASDTLKDLLSSMDSHTDTAETAPTVVDTQVSGISVLKSAKSVIIVPGYGMAIAQAQHLVKQLADKLVANGASVKYAVHPVAGRMPGHMNVLLCEADVDYEDLYEMDDINPEFANTDAVIVVGANDVLNPSARDAEGTPIYGMPILNVDNAKEIFIFNYDTNPGYAGVDNPLYTRTKGVHLYLGNASDTLQSLLDEWNK